VTGAHLQEYEWVGGAPNCEADINTYIKTQLMGAGALGKLFFGGN
jgi:hypothetical protein